MGIEEWNEKEELLGKRVSRHYRQRDRMIRPKSMTRR